MVDKPHYIIALLDIPESIKNWFAFGVWRDSSSSASAMKFWSNNGVSRYGNGYKFKTLKGAKQRAEALFNSGKWDQIMVIGFKGTAGGCWHRLESDRFIGFQKDWQEHDVAEAIARWEEHKRTQA